MEYTAKEKTWIILKPVGEKPVALIIEKGAIISGDNILIFSSENKWKIEKKKLGAIDL